MFLFYELFYCLNDTKRGMILSTIFLFLFNQCIFYFILFFTFHMFYSHYSHIITCLNDTIMEWFQHVLSDLCYTCNFILFIYFTYFIFHISFTLFTYYCMYIWHKTCNGFNYSMFYFNYIINAYYKIFFYWFYIILFTYFIFLSHCLHYSHIITRLNDTKHFLLFYLF